jgi:hypothetical protein
MRHRALPASRVIFLFKFLLIPFAIVTAVLAYRGNNPDPENPLTRHYAFFRDRWAPLKIFIYNISDPDEPYRVRQHFGDRWPTNGANQITELIVRHSLQQSRFAHADPASADIFYAPFYLSVDAMTNRRARGCDFEARYAPLLRGEGPWYDRYGGVDHAFVQMSPPYPQRAPVHAGNVDGFPGMLTLSDIPRAVCERPRHAWHFTQLPHGSAAPVSAGGGREISAFFGGSPHSIDWRRPASPMRLEIIRQMQFIAASEVSTIEAEDSLFQRVDDAHYLRMRVAEMCVLPDGDAPTSRGLTDALRSLCLPLVFSDEARFPFSGQWRTLKM